GADNQVFAIGFVPDRHDVRALFGREDESAQLRFGLLCKTVTDPDGEFGNFEHLSYSSLFCGWSAHGCSLQFPRQSLVIRVMCWKHLKFCTESFPKQMSF